MVPMDASYNNRSRGHNQLTPFEDSNTVNAICLQINQLNNCFTNYQISNNKKIESINSKVDFQLRTINGKLESLSGEIKELTRKVSTPTKDASPALHKTNDKVLELFNKHINKLSNDIQELGSSLYMGNDNNNWRQISGKVTPSMGRTTIQNDDETQKTYNNYKHTTSEIMPIDMAIDNRNKTWSKSLSVRSPVHQPNSAPSSPFAKRFSFDFPAVLDKNLPNRRGTTYTNQEQNVIENNNSELRLDHIQHANNDVGRKKDKEPNAHINEANTGDTQYVYPISTLSPEKNLHGTKEPIFSGTKGPRLVKSTMESHSLGIVQQNASQSEYENFTNRNQLDGLHHTPTMTHKNHTLEIEVDPSSLGRVTNTNTGKNRIFKPQSSSMRRPLIVLLENSRKLTKMNIPGTTLIKNRKLSLVPQYKLEKSLRNVFEIWKEYEYGINGKPPLKQLEIQYNTKWRNETELRTYLRRKKIYDAIEKGKEVGYSERQIIEELEGLRNYDKYGVMKKKPLLWLYCNIPDKFS